MEIWKRPQESTESHSDEDMGCLDLSPPPSLSTVIGRYKAELKWKDDEDEGLNKSPSGYLNCLSPLLSSLFCRCLPLDAELEYPPSLSPMIIAQYKESFKWDEEVFGPMFEDDDSLSPFWNFNKDDDLDHKLLKAAGADRADEAVQILEKEPNLIRIGDCIGDTPLHVAVRAMNWYTVERMIKCLEEERYTLLCTALSEVNEQGDTPDDIALKNGCQKAALHLLIARSNALNKIRMKTPVRSVLLSGDDNDEEEDRHDNLLGLENKAPRNAAFHLFVDQCRPVIRARKENTKLHEEVKLCLIADIEMGRARSQLSVDDGEEEVEDGVLLHYAAEKGEQNVISQLLMEDPNLLKIKDPETGDNPFHIAARNGQLRALKKMVNFLHNNRKLKMSSRLIYEANNVGNNPLHLAVQRGHEETARYLTEVEPKAVCIANHQKDSPLCLAVKKGHLDLVRSMIGIHQCQSDRNRLLQHAKMVSLANTTLITRNLAMLQAIMEALPELIDTPDRRGWKPLSYAASKGYVDEVSYFLIKFPESVWKHDVDGSLPIHKAVANRQKAIVMQFSLHCPQTLYEIDDKGRNIVDIATKYGSQDVLSYLRENNILDRLSNLRDINQKQEMDNKA